MAIIGSILGWLFSILLGILALSLFLTGFWLNRTGKPYGTLIFTIHKAIGLRMGILLFIATVTTGSLYVHSSPNL